MNNIGISYLLWCGWFFGFAGLHRLYNKKFITGFLWLFTWGIFGLGQIVDLLLIPSMVEEHNLKVRRRLGFSPKGIPLGYDPLNPTLPDSPYGQTDSRFTHTQSLSKEQLMVKLAEVAQKRGGKISVTQAVIDTGVSFEEVQAALNEMVKQGYVGVDNHPTTGVVIYDFLEL
ncbi:MAG: NINE protein [Xenococcaceae cyanobacterium]